jgi:hypothetical protein
MKIRFSYFLVAILLSLGVLTVGKLAGERLRGIAARFLSTPMNFNDPVIEENRFLKKALKEIADGEREVPVSVEGKVSAKVIYRPVTDWLSSFWVDLGSENGGGLIGVNSPVLYRGALLGIIDQVGAKQSRVLLVTDPKLRVAVRVARGDAKRFLISHHIDHLIHLLEQEPPPFHFLRTLDDLKDHYLPEGDRWLLAKGELRGSLQGGIALKGLGFNLETGDRQGPARDLRTGVPYDDPTSKPIPLIQLYDLLVTSGLDGLFPEGLDVALVTSIAPLDEGDVAYNLEAEPLFGPLEEISAVDILPPLPFDSRDLSPLVKKIR